MFNLGTPEVIVLLAIALLLFGKHLPGAARSLGKSFVEFRKGLSGVEEEVGSTLKG
jgi:sec-independent protein translocase protein TatA